MKNRGRYSLPRSKSFMCMCGGGLCVVVGCRKKYQRTFERKSFNLGFCGCSKSCSGVPSSKIMPSAMKRTRSPTSRAKPISCVTTTIVMP